MLFSSGFLLSKCITNHRFAIKSSQCMLILFFCFCCFCRLESIDKYNEPQNVATTEGLPSSLVNRAVCAITGEYTDSMVDVVIPGPEPLVINRMYSSSSGIRPWNFNHYDCFFLGQVIYQGVDSYIVRLRQPSGSLLDYVHDKKTIDDQKHKRIDFNLVVPKGLTNGASALSGKTNIKNQTVRFLPDKELIVTTSGNGSRKIFKRLNQTNHARPLCGQISEEKINGNRIRYEGQGSGLSGASRIICENRESGQQYSTIDFYEKTDKKNHISTQTLKTSDGRTLSYQFECYNYKVREKYENQCLSHHEHRHYLTKVDHPYAPFEEYRYEEKALSKDKQICAKLRDNGRNFLKIKYYHKGTNDVGGEVGSIQINDDDDFRLDRVRYLEAPVGTDGKPAVTHRFDYHADIKKMKNGLKKISRGYTDVYDAKNHKVRYKYDDEHRLTSITHFSGTSASSYVPYTKECFVWDHEGTLLAKIFKDGEGNIHHARQFIYDSYGNVQTSILCGKLTGAPCAPVSVDKSGKVRGGEREIKNIPTRKMDSTCF